MNSTTGLGSLTVQMVVSPFQPAARFEYLCLMGVRSALLAQGLVVGSLEPLATPPAYAHKPTVYGKGRCVNTPRASEAAGGR
jgi:hypothetical protein